MSSVEKIYNTCPVFLQNWLISAYGLKLKREYGKHYKAVLAELLESEHFSVSEIKKSQNKILRQLTGYALRNVPYYREMANAANEVASNITVDTISDYFPVLSKDTFRDNQERFLSREFNPQRLLKINTSGTTGKPLTIYTTHEARQSNYAFMTRFMHWAGIRQGEKSVTFAGRVFIPPHQKEPPYWRSNWWNNNYLFSSFNITPDNVPDYLEQLERIQPVFIDSYPSAIAAIANYILENSLKVNLHLKAIITSSETLSREQRTRIEQAFNVRVFDQYGNAEMAAFAGQCEHGQYHLNPEYGIAELLDESGNAVGPGEIGQLVVTGFLNKAMPLIRYQIGDSAILSDVPCACGRHFPVLQEIVGRRDDLIKTRSGRIVGRLDPIYKGLAGVRESQIVQPDIDNIVVYIVTASGYEAWMEDSLLKELKKRVGLDINITVSYVPEIPRTSSGKMRAVISHVK
jgi:phenylacetate-CoA ligase